jgi:uncharacterized protein GlcG (DUF336 family)
MKRRIDPLIALVIGILTIAAGASAQTTEKQSLNRDGALRVIAVEHLDNTFPAGANISIGKVRTAAIFKKPTRFFEEIIRKGRTPMVALNDFTPLQGGVPIELNGQVVGDVGVSGAASAQEDDDLATIAASALSRLSVSNSGPVEQWGHDAVAASFAKGAVLFESPQFNYAIHTSQRTQLGLAKVHARETDLIRVVAGEATFVTGGTVVDPKPVAADEIPGRVSGTFQYYTIKVRDYPAAQGQVSDAR